MIDRRQNEPTAVLFLFGTLEIGGSERKFVRLAKRFSECGMPVHAAYLDGPEDLLPDLANVPTTFLERSGKWSLRAFQKLKRYVTAHDVETIVAVNFYPLLYAVPLSLMLRRRTRVVVSINTSELLTERDQLFLWIYRPLINACSKVVMGSENQRALWIREYGLNEVGTRVIYNGVDTVHFSRNEDYPGRSTVRQEFGLSDGAFAFVCVGQLRPEKGHSNLLRACADLNTRGGTTMNLVIVGDGAAKQALEQLACELGINENVFFVGAVQDVRPYLGAADVFVLTSTAVETFSNAALEACAMSLPVIISDVGGAREMFAESEGAVIYPREDIEALTEAMANLMDRLNQDADLGDRLREHVTTNFSLGQMDAAWENALWGDSR